MALYADFVFTHPPTTKQVEWHDGDEWEITEINHSFASCVSIQADGDELEAIRNQFENIPFHRARRVQRWFGDHAKFIALHLGNS